jgi:NAD(P)-dependent dehydrogenase (short-subunit alcohol dehydrogenase family)
MGLGVAQALAARGGWQIHIIDVKEEEGNEAAKSLNGHFHKVDLTNYVELGAAFKAAFIAGGSRLDFVFANAGIVERTSIFGAPDTLDPPPEPNFLPLDVNLRGCINTVHIGRHYLGQSPEKGSIVVTGSAASVYPSFFSPVYTASKCEISLSSQFPKIRFLY